MLIEIHGAGFKNKGAELMLRTTLHELKTRIPNFIPAIDPYYGDFEARCNLGLMQLFPSRFHVGTPGYSKRLLKQTKFADLKIERLISRFAGVKLKDYGCVGLSDVQALIDISGFAYTDQWGSQPIKDFAKLTSYYKSKGKPVILLPQALGPFKKDETISGFRKIMDNASLIFPRDKTSYQYVKELCPDSEKVFKATDITLFYPKNNIPITQPSSDYVCIIPNGRMYDQGNEQWGQKYEPYLIQIAQEILRLGLNVYIVVHDSSGLDLPIAESLIDKLVSENITLVTESNPIALKEIIGSSRMVIGSRFHSLVASFSKGVPAIALGWSHKYEMLFEDFGCGQFIVSHNTQIENVLELVNKLADKDSNYYWRKKIKQELTQMQSDNQNMWDSVVRIITNTEE